MKPYSWTGIERVHKIKTARQTLQVFKEIKNESHSHDTPNLQQASRAIIQRTWQDTTQYQDYIYRSLYIRETAIDKIQKELDKWLHEHSYEQLKKYRKYGMRLKNIVRLLNTTETNKEFSKLIRDFWIVKDHLHQQQVDRDTKQELFDNFAETFHNNHNVNIDIQPVNRSKLDERLSDRTENINKHIQYEALDIDTFHKIRKQLRDMMIFLRFAAANKQFRWQNYLNESIVCQYLQHIIDPMEIIHDLTIESTLAVGDSIKDVEKRIVTLDNKIRDKIQQYLIRRGK